MSSTKLILRSVNSNFPSPFQDITLGRVLSHNDLDNNQIYLKSQLIHSGTTYGTTLSLLKIGGGTIDIDLNSIVSATDNYTTGATLEGDIVYFDRSDSLSAYTLDLTSLDVNDTFISGASFNNGTFDLSINRNDGTTFTENLSILASDRVVTGGTYNINTGIVTYATNSGNTFQVSGFTSGMTDNYTTGATLNGYILEFDKNGVVNDYNVDLSSLEFTGNTSGSCINELWVSNVYGCSPITIHDSIQYSTSRASGTSSTAFGDDTTASGYYSHAEGISTLASGVGAHVEGNNSVASGSISHAEGDGTSATTVGSHAEGGGTIASGNYSHAEGITTIAGAEFSHTEGFQTETVAGATASHAEGYRTIVSGQYSHVGGQGHSSSDRVLASGNTSFAHFRVTGFTGDIGATGDHSVVLGGVNNQSSSDSSGVFGGKSNEVSSGATNSVILGGDGLIASESNTVYVPNLEIQAGKVIKSGNGSGTLKLDNNSIIGEVFLGDSSGGLTIGRHGFGISATSNDGVSILSSDNSSIISGTIVNSVILGGVGITADTSNTVYVPDLEIQGGKVIKSGTDRGQIEFNSWGTDTVFLSTDNGGGGQSGLFISPTYTELFHYEAGAQIYLNASELFLNSTFSSSFNTGVTNSVILGGDGITASASNTAYVPTLNLNTTLANDNVLTQVLVRAADGTVKYKDVASFTDLTVTGGTYDINTGIVTFVNNTGSTFEVSGFASGMTDSYTTTATTSGNIINFNNNIQGSNLYSVDLTPMLSSVGVTIDPYQLEGNVNIINWDVSGTSTNYEATLTGDTTLNMSNVRNGDYGTLIVTQDGTGSHTLTFGTGTHKVVNGGGGTPTLTATAGAVDVLSFTYNGSTFYWTVGNDYT